MLVAIFFWALALYALKVRNKEQWALIIIRDKLSRIKQHRIRLNHNFSQFIKMFPHKGPGFKVNFHRIILYDRGKYQLPRTWYKFKKHCSKPKLLYSQITKIHWYTITRQLNTSKIWCFNFWGLNQNLVSTKYFLIPRTQLPSSW